jgi:hypothetical protein
LSVETNTLAYYAAVLVNTVKTFYNTGLCS